MAWTKVQSKDIKNIATLTSWVNTAYALSIERSEYNDREIIPVTFHVDSDVAPTLNINGLWAKPIVDDAGVALIAWALKNRTAYNMRYNLSLDSFVLMGSVTAWGTSVPTYTVVYYFDDVTANLPTDTSIQIDGNTIMDGDIVYTADGDIMQASVSGTTITRTLISTTQPWDTVYVTSWDTYGDTIINPTQTIFPNWLTITIWTEVISNTYNAKNWEYIVVTNSLSDTTITLPQPISWSKVCIKKFTWEDVRVITILPNLTETIDWFTGATMNINRTMYTFTAVAGNWYLGD